MFIRRILLSLFGVVFSVSSFGQMSEESIYRYVTDRQSQGASQEEIVIELGRRGVTTQQLQRMRDKYGRQQATSVFGSTSELEDDPSRVRSAGRAFNRIGSSDVSDGVSQSLYDESVFLFADSSVFECQQNLIAHPVVLVLTAFQCAC